MEELFQADDCSPVATVSIAAVPDVKQPATSGGFSWHRPNVFVAGVILAMLLGSMIALAGFARDVVSASSRENNPRRESSGPTTSAQRESVDHGPPSTVAKTSHDELSRLVKSNPRAAAEAIRSWVDPAA